MGEQMNRILTSLYQALTICNGPWPMSAVFELEQASTVSPRAKQSAAGGIVALTRRSACIYVTSCPLLSHRVASFSLLGAGRVVIQRTSNSRRWRAQERSRLMSVHCLDRLAFNKYLCTSEA